MSDRRQRLQNFVDGLWGERVFDVTPAGRYEAARMAIEAGNVSPDDIRAILDGETRRDRVARATRLRVVK